MARPHSWHSQLRGLSQLSQMQRAPRGKVSFPAWERGLGKTSVLVEECWPVTHGLVTLLAGTVLSDCSVNMDPNWTRVLDRKYKENPELRYSGEWKSKGLGHRNGKKQNYSLFIMLIENGLLGNPRVKSGVWAWLRLCILTLYNWYEGLGWEYRGQRSSHFRPLRPNGQTGLLWLREGNQQS